jgi:hypothetical protein
MEDKGDHMAQARTTFWDDLIELWQQIVDMAAISLAALLFMILH